MSGCASCGPFCVGIFYILGLLLTVSRLASSVARSMPRGTAAHGFTTRELLSDLSIVEGEPWHRQTTGTLLGTSALQFWADSTQQYGRVYGSRLFHNSLQMVHPSSSRGSVLSLAQLKLSSTSRSMRLSVICCSAWSGAVPR